jgi:hypothetical protein
MSYEFMSLTQNYSLQWRDRAGFTPASLFSPLSKHGAPGRFFLKRTKETEKLISFTVAARTLSRSHRKSQKVGG